MKQPEEIRKTYPGLEALSVEELDDLLQEEFLLSDQDGPDTDLIQAILAEIQIKEGTTTPSEEAQASLEAFFADQDQREAAPEEPTSPKRNAPTTASAGSPPWWQQPASSVSSVPQWPTGPRRWSR